jgi:hypothetical protein
MQYTDSFAIAVVNIALLNMFKVSVNVCINLNAVIAEFIIIIIIL